MIEHTYSRRKLTRVGFGLVGVGLALACVDGCGSPGQSVGSTSNAVTSAVTWRSVSYGVGGTTVSAGNNVLVVYGGYSATDADSRALALALTGTASFSGLGIGSVYAARGPEDPSYAAREIGNSELAAAIEPETGSADFVIVVAHSSGAFVADELFTESSPALLAKIAYFALDGGTWALSDALIAKMKAVSFVYAKDAIAGESHNASAMMSLHQELSPSNLLMVDADGSGCHVGATWCLHDTLITTRPHNPATYDLALDYQDFTGAGRHVVTSYIDQAIADNLLARQSTTVAKSDSGAPPVPIEPSPEAGTSRDAAPPPAMMPGSGSGSSSGSGSGNGGVSCSTDGDCNTGNDGSGQICVGKVCVAGCNADWECPGSTTCVSGQCR